jgi:CubicO group peptidase (beta-lactamase class C family)
METRNRTRSAGRGPLLVGASAMLILLSLISCVPLFGFGPTEDELRAVDFTPLVREDWQVSTPEAEGLDPLLVAEAYYNAAQLETIHSLLVIKNGRLIAEDYFNGGEITQSTRIQSVSKSFTSALVGIALEQGYLTSVDQKMVDFFPEFMPMYDPRKEEITIRHLLQMRAGYPWEESSPELFNLLWYEGFRPSNLVDVPLIRDPGTDHDYSNLSSHILAIIVARATGTDLMTFATENLMSPLGAVITEWDTDWEYYYIGHGGIRCTARDMAKFGLLYLDDGQFGGNQIVPADWVAESLQTYTEDAVDYRVGRNFKDIGYGYQWWSARTGDRHYNLAWGHGGQLIFLLDDLDMVVVVKADPFQGQSDGTSWSHEKANVNLVADFIASLPSE